MAHTFLRLLLSTLLYGESPTGPDGGGDMSHSWSYTGDSGPSNWTRIYSTCSGTRQSPVDIQDRNIIYTPDLPQFFFQGFDGTDSFFTLTNNGHTASISVVGNISVEGGGLDGQYKTAELHFHWGSQNNHGSEHAVNGRKYPLELHIVNYATKYGSLTNAMRYRDGLAVLGTFFEIGKENPSFQPVERGIQRCRFPGNYTGLMPLNLRALLPGDTSRYFRYYGSLTTPPCHQSVLWTIFEAVQSISPFQIHMLRQLYESVHDHHHTDHHSQHGHSGHGDMLNQNLEIANKLSPLVDNFRPVQPDFDRVINTNINRYADPSFVKQTRILAETNPKPRRDFLTQRLAQFGDIETLFNSTLQRWLHSKGLPLGSVGHHQAVMSLANRDPERLSGRLFPGFSNSHELLRVHDIGQKKQSGHPSLQPPAPPPLSEQRRFQGQHRAGGHNTQSSQELVVEISPNHNSFRIGGQEFQAQVIVDQGSGQDTSLSSYQLQQILNDPATQDQIQRILNNQNSGGQIHEIIVASPVSSSQQFPSVQQQSMQKQHNVVGTGIGTGRHQDPPGTARAQSVPMAFQTESFIAGTGRGGSRQIPVQETFIEELSYPLQWSSSTHNDSFAARRMQGVNAPFIQSSDLTVVEPSHTPGVTAGPFASQENQQTSIQHVGSAGGQQSGINPLDYSRRQQEIFPMREAIFYPEQFPGNQHTPGILSTNFRNARNYPGRTQHFPANQPNFSRQRPFNYPGNPRPRGIQPNPRPAYPGASAMDYPGTSP